MTLCLDLTKLRIAFVAAEKTQHSAAQLLKISEKAMSEKMCGKTDFKIDEVLEICGFLRIEIGQVLSKKNTEHGI